MHNAASTLERFGQKLGAYERWREKLASSIQAYHNWLEGVNETDSDDELKLFELLDSLNSDKLMIALVGEFSRGKTELINAIFFADYKRRLLPSTPGRTTMCPTELLYDPNQEPCLKLLPIDTRKSSMSISDHKKSTVNWTTLPLNVNSAEDMAQTLQELIRIQSVSAREARLLGFLPASSVAREGEITSVDIPVWRHALINYPHELLKKGLVVLDTPGLNALGSEPELTISMLPSAHAVLFVLAADTGVTQSDMEIWRDHVCAATHTNADSRIATLNKIDTLWDELLSENQINAGISQQVDFVKDRLGIKANNVFPVSAHKGLLGKVKNDSALIQRSGLLDLELKLSDDIIAYKQELLRNKIVSEIGGMVESSKTLINTQKQSLETQLKEIRELQGKNENVINGMIEKLKKQKQIYDKEVESFHKTRHMLSEQIKSLLILLSINRFDQLIIKTRKAMQDSWTTQGLRRGMSTLFGGTSETMKMVESRTAQIEKVVNDVYHRFHKEHGLPKLSPVRYSVTPFIQQYAQLDNQALAFRNSPRLLLTEQHFVIKNFFISLVSKARTIFSDCNSATRNWAKTVLAPVFTQIQEHKIMIDQRLDNLEKLRTNHASLAERVNNMTADLNDLRAKSKMIQNVLDNLDEHSKDALDIPPLETPIQDTITQESIAS